MAWQGILGNAVDPCNCFLHPDVPALLRTVVAAERLPDTHQYVSSQQSHIIKILFLPYANNKGTDQPAHSHSLINTFVIHCSDSTILLVSISKISSLKLVTVAEEASLSHTWSQTPEDRFSCDVARKRVSEKQIRWVFQRWRELFFIMCTVRIKFQIQCVPGIWMFTDLFMYTEHCRLHRILIFSSPEPKAYTVSF